MNMEMTLEEAQILIAVLVFAEGAAMGHSIVEALKVLRPWRSALLLGYLRAEAEALAASKALEEPAK